MKKLLLLLILVGIIFIAGCISQATTSKDVSISDLITNPNNYINHNVTITGNLILNKFGYLAGVIYLQDDQGYEIKTDCKEEGRAFGAGKYKATGFLENSTFGISFKCVEPMIKIS